MALVVLAIALLGTIGVLLMTHQHNTAASEASLATKACQEVIEQLRAMSYDSMLLQNDVTFVAKKVHPSWPIGVIQVSDISPSDDPDTKAEVRVRIQTQPGQVTQRPVNVELVTWRSRR